MLYMCNGCYRKVNERQAHFLTFEKGMDTSKFVLCDKCAEQMKTFLSEKKDDRKEEKNENG